MARKIEVVPHNPAWKEQFAAESKLIKKLLGRNCQAVHHIGSTAVEDLWAKPTIDILVTVKNLNDLTKLEQAGYTPMGEAGIPGRRYFVKGEDVHLFHVHVFHMDDRENIQRHLAVVEYLKGNEKRREEYSQLKGYLAEAYPEDPEGYWEGKRYFVAQLQQEALNAYQSTEEDHEEEPRSLPVSLGMALGLIIGLVMNNIGVGLCIGLACAFVISKLKDK